MRVLRLLASFLLGLFAVARPSLGRGAEPVVLVVYDGYGTPDGYVVSGRVLRDQREAQPDAGASEGQNLVNMMKALESDELPGVEVVVTVAGTSHRVTTDDDGVFELRVSGLTGADRLPDGLVPVTAELAPVARMRATPANGALHVHPNDVPFIAVVSDIDDTVVKTHVVSKRAMATAVLLKNAAQLEPVVGASAAYAAASAAGVRGFFYVSSSPQNLYPRLRHYLSAQTFPAGPLLLKNFGRDKVFGHADYKGSRLRQLLTMFPSMRVVLVGDSGERDPEIYRSLQAEQPDRVVAVVIRGVPGADNAPARLAGFTVVNDRYETDDVIAALVRADLERDAPRTDAVNGPPTAP